MSSWHIRAVLAGKYLRKSRDEISSSGYVVDTLEAALWAFAHADDFQQLAVSAATTQTRWEPSTGSLPVPTSVSRDPSRRTSQVRGVDMIINTATALHDLV